MNVGVAQQLINPLDLTGLYGFEDFKGCGRGTEEFGIRYGRLPALAHGIQKRLHFVLLPFVLAEQILLPALAVGMDSQAFEVFQYCRAAMGKDFDSFLGQASVAVGEVCNAPNRAIGVGDGHVQGIVEMVGIAHHVGENGDRQRSVQVRQEVDEVADLSDDPAAAEIEVLNPRLPGYRPGINPEGHCHRT